GQASRFLFFFFFQAEDGIRDFHVTGVQTCALPIYQGELFGTREGIAGKAGDGPRLQQPTALAVEGPLHVLRILPVAQRPLHAAHEVRELESLFVREHIVRRVAPSPLEHGRPPRRLDHDFLWRDPATDQGFPETGDGADGDHVPPARARVTGEGDAGGHRFLGRVAVGPYHAAEDDGAKHRVVVQAQSAPDRKSTRLNSSHVKISYAVFCL